MDSSIHPPLVKSDAKEPAERLRGAPRTTSAIGRSDEEDRDAHKQGEPGRSKQRHECLKKVFAPLRAGRDTVDDICHRAESLSVILGRRTASGARPTRRTCGRTMPGIPRWRIARWKRVREDLVQRPLGGKAGVSIAGLVNDAGRVLRRPGRRPRRRCRDIRLRFLCEA